MKNLPLALCCALGLLGCGGDEDSPIEKCDDLIENICERGVECIPADGTKAECVQAFQQVLPCGNAKEVSATYDRCMSQISSNSCTILFPTDQNGDRTIALPADCNQVIVGDQSSTAERAAFAGDEAKLRGIEAVLAPH